MLCDSVPGAYHVWVGNEKACRHYKRVKELSIGPPACVDAYVYVKFKEGGKDTAAKMQA